MKKLLLLVFFLPLVSFGQITLQEILSIDSENTFIRTMIENGFEDETAPERADKQVTYRKDMLDQFITASFKRSDSINDAGLMVIFTSDMYEKNDIYDGIYNLVKKDCQFKEIRERLGSNIAMYTCPDPNPDPRLVELNTQLMKKAKNNTSYNLTDLEIGFHKSNGLYIIDRRINTIADDTMVEVLTMMLELNFDELKESLKDSIQK